MKVLHLLAQLPMKTGSGVYFSNLIKEFDRLGHENILLYGIQEPYIIDLPASNTYEIKFQTDVLPFPIVGMSDIMPYPSTRYSNMTSNDIKKYMEAYRNALTKIKEEHDPDMVISHHLFWLTDTALKIFDDKRVTGICHGTDLRQIKKHPRFMSGLTNIGQLYRVLTVSQNDVETVHELLGIPYEKIVRVGGGFDSEIFNTDYTREPIRNGEYKIMYAGKITNSKGVYELAKTLPVINRAYPNAELHIIGNASNGQRLELENASGNSKNLYVYNAVSQTEMANILKQSDVFVLPSYYEALGLVAIEALATGTRTVATAIDGLMLQLGEEVNLSGAIEYVKLPRIYDTDKAYDEDKPEFIKRLSEKIILQLNRVAANEKIPPRIMDAIDKNSWETLAKKIEALISK